MDFSKEDKNDMEPSIGEAVELLRREVRALSAKYADLDRKVQRDFLSEKFIIPDKVALQNELSAALDKQRILDVAADLHRARVEALEDSLARVTEQNRVSSGKSAKEIAATKAELEKHKRAAAAARNEIDNLRKSLTFELGQVMAAGATSFSGFMALPKRLWSIYSRHHSRAGETTPGQSRPVVKLDPVSIKRETAHRMEHLEKIRAKWRKKHGRAESFSAADLRAMRVAGIMDTFTLRSFEPECQILELTPSGCIQELRTFNPDMVFLESAWRGKDGLWKNNVRPGNPAVMEIITWCRKNAVPVVFWNKEDPLHFDWFINLARECDFVFTTDLDCVAKYKKILRHDNVHVLPFAAQPRMHNPLEKYARKDAVAFAGSYYVRLKNRSQDLEELLDAVSEVKPLVIFDRQQDNEDPNYCFPERFGQFIVGGLPYEEIDRAYKEYKYAININSINSSLSMFARRVFELLACNTIVLSNYAHGLKTMFGDLVIASDDGKTVVQKLLELENGATRLEKLRLAGLRAVMQEHTYQDRLSFVAEKVFGVASPVFLPHILVFANIETPADAQRTIANFRRQSYARKTLYLICPDKIQLNDKAADDIVVLASKSAKAIIKKWDKPDDWIAVMSPLDYYGKNYLLDLALATRYSDATVLGKESRFRCSNGEISEQAAGAAYTPTKFFPARRAIAKISSKRRSRFIAWFRNKNELLFDEVNALAIDKFNYCEDAFANGSLTDDVPIIVDDVAVVSGCGMNSLTRYAESIHVDHAVIIDSVRYSAKQLFAMLNQNGRPKDVALKQVGDVLSLDVNLPDSHAYWYSNTWLTEKQIGLIDSGQPRRLLLNMHVSPGRNVEPVIKFADTNQQQISVVVHKANSDASIPVPSEAKWFQLHLRASGLGQEDISELILKQSDIPDSAAVGFGDYLLIAPAYPSREALYRLMFVHARVKEYRKAGLNVDVFRFQQRAARTSTHEFEGVECITGDQSALRSIIENGKYKKIIVHFLTPEVWKVLETVCENIPIIVWLHGAEILPYHRRAFDHTTETEKERALAASKQRVAFWDSILKPVSKNLKLVFVSQHFADEVMEDYQVNLSAEQYQVIHNPIDTDIFSYVPKSPEQRKRIISIRPFTVKTYANDLTVKAILSLKDESFFNDLHFCIIGDGALFEETVAPLTGLQNVTVEQGFLSMSEIAELYKEYGVVLIPTRYDTHGVSRDEAMASGLVPITSRVAAVPEFVDETCGILADDESYLQLAEGIKRLYNSPELFSAMSEAAYRRIMTQTAKSHCIKKEIELLNIEKVSIGKSIAPGCLGNRENHA